MQDRRPVVRSDGDGLTLEQLLDSVWEGLCANGAAEPESDCPVCLSDLGWRRVAAGFCCRACASTLT